MTSKHKKDGPATPDPSQAGVADPPHDKTMVMRGKDRRRRERNLTEGERLVVEREMATATREDVALVREMASNLREDAVYLREGAAKLREEETQARQRLMALREVEIRLAQTLQTVVDNQMAMLREANEKLVIASIASHLLTEEVRVAKIKAEHLAHHDVLTGLPNRVLFQDRMGQAIELACRQGGHLAVMFIDVDRFKYINDSLGHAVGDQLLKSIAQRLESCMRHSDTVSRQGGDEFVVLLPTIQHREEAALAADKVIAAFLLPHHIQANELYISLSIGISIFPDDGKDATTLLRCADTAMYHAKENGRNAYKFFEPNMRVLAVQRQSTEASLRRALERHEFVLHYQPKINLEYRMIVGVEALIRWRHPERGLLLPADFVPIAEECGLILPIGRWVLHEACRQACAWREAGLPAITVAVNTSAREFRAKDFLDNLRATLHDTGLEPRYLEIELTESVLMQDLDSTGAVLQALADLGVKLAVDDFGTGYSSLSYLRQFPINALKIDQSFVNDMTCKPDDATLVTAMINMAKSLKHRVIAEGIETAEQHAFLLSQQCDEGQGFYFGRPMDAQDIVTLLHSSASFNLPYEWAQSSTG